MLIKQNKVYAFLKKINLILGLIILALCFYLIAAPILPKTGFIANTKEWFKDDILHLKRNKILINSIGVNAEILEGDESELNLGIWHIPYTSNPANGGNTVIIAHRYLYNYGPNTFFNLDKLVLGDQIKITWDSQIYTYKVTETKIVESTQTDIQNNTPNSILTLYTCTSLTDTSKRLVVIAELIN